ncbi:hypothetical protein AMECASPLE_029464 [Ameca splendens]|uniref:Uncharacterized protein n=1 Tax=Ameca splendens TaxID=208324 RepID=A0ABV0Y6A2_9TELE
MGRLKNTLENGMKPFKSEINSQNIGDNKSVGAASKLTRLFPAGIKGQIKEACIKRPQYSADGGVRATCSSCAPPSKQHRAKCCTERFPLAPMNESAQKIA